MHYTPHGHARTDRTRLGIVFAKQPPRERVLTLSAVNDTFRIPPGDPNYRVDASFEIGTDVKLASLHPHMHGREGFGTAWCIRRARRTPSQSARFNTGRIGNLSNPSRCQKHQ
jgi:hypothetical protein